MGFEPTEPVRVQRFSSPFGPFLEMPGLTSESPETPCPTWVSDLSSSLVITREFASLLVLPRPQRAPRCSRCPVLVSVAEGLVDVLHETDELQVVGRCLLELGDEMQIEVAGLR